MNNLIPGSAETLQERLGPPVDITEIEGETDIELVNERVFELYKEVVGIVNLTAHLLDDTAAGRGGWARNQAICAGLMIRIWKFMVVVVQLSATRNRADVVFALNRSIMESLINLEFLVTKNDEQFFDQFVRFSLGPERELYDVIKANVTARGGEMWPIEQRMLDSINDVCQASGVSIEEVNQKYGDWGGGVKERLKALNRETQYVAIQRLPSHAVHGSWVDLYKHHLAYDAKTSTFGPDTDFSSVDARLLGPVATLVLETTKPYLGRFFTAIPETKLLLSRIDDLIGRIVRADARHEALMK